MIRIGLLTGGGDCPGLNGVIRAVVRCAAVDGDAECVGFRHGWAGVLRDDAIDLTLSQTAGILPRGGTILGTSRTNPYAAGADGTADVKAALAARGVDVLIPIGGEDTLGVALRLHRDGVPVVGVPKTIDNDLGGTDFTFGFQTAVQIVCDAVDRLHTTAESHDRVMVVEVMGRHAGWIATYGGIAGGADAILVPERPFDIERVVGHVQSRHRRGRTFSIVVVAEGAAALEGTMPPPQAGRHRRLRPPAARRRRPGPRQRDRGPHRIRDARDDPRPRPARRHAGGLRPRARDALRRRRGARRERRPARRDGRAARHRHRGGGPRGGARGAQAARPRAVRDGFAVLRMSAMNVDPTREDLSAFMAADDGGPVVMLNLLRYDGESGRESYRRYAAAAGPFFERVGGRVLYAGDCDVALVAPDGHRWDALLVVLYPSRAAFLEMVKDPEYQQITHLRSDGLSAAVLHATRPWGPGEAPAEGAG